MLSMENAKGCSMITYENFENIDFVDEGRIILELFLLNRFDRILLVAFTMLSQVDDAKATIGQLLLEGVDLFDVSFSRVYEVLWLGSSIRTGSACATSTL